jgi:hypothetical protein
MRLGAPGPIWTGVEKRKSLAATRVRTPNRSAIPTTLSRSLIRERWIIMMINNYKIMIIIIIIILLLTTVACKNPVKSVLN